MTSMIAQWRARTRDLKRELFALYLALRDPRTPLAAKVVGGIVIAYAVSPIDVIPDFIPVLGSLDDLILVPLGLMLVRRMIPPTILEEHRAAAAVRSERIRSVAAAAVIVTLWVVAIALTVWFVRTRFG